MDTLKKYFTRKDIDFVNSVYTTFNQRIFFECSDKIIPSNNGTQKTEKRYIVGIKCDNTMSDKYFTFMNVSPIKLEADDYHSVYLGYDISNNIKKIYFENDNGIICYEITNNIVKVKHYTKTVIIPDKVLQSIPESLRIVVRDNISVLFVCRSKNKKTYYFQLQNALEYNQDFVCGVIAVAFDTNWNILYHTYYLRIKEICQDGDNNRIFRRHVLDE